MYSTSAPETLSGANLSAAKVREKGGSVAQGSKIEITTKPGQNNITSTKTERRGKRNECVNMPTCQDIMHPNPNIQ